MMSTHLLEVVKRVRPRRALLTTYTLSLSYFEALLLTTLRHVGCGEIVLLADEKRAGRTVAESGAQYVGRRYRLLPVRCPEGVFHPTLGYFEGTERDVITVGSGNLTVAGQSVQLETLDAVDSASEPAVFLDFAGFAEALAVARGQQAEAVADVLSSFARRARSRAGNGAARPNAARLLHNLSTTGGAGILGLWTETEQKAKSLTVLSPFHSADGSATQLLASGLGLTRAVVGVQPPASPAPLNESARNLFDWVSPVSDRDDAPLHAKVFEVVGERGCMVMTGSFNATTQSLWTCRNVEVSLARFLPAPCFEWTPIEPVGFRPNLIEDDEADGNSLAVRASLVGGRILGAIERLPAMAAEARCTLLRNSVPIVEPIPVALTDGGAFVIAPPDSLPSTGGLQLLVEASDMRGLCWLQMEDELSLSNAAYQVRQAANAVLGGAFTGHQVAALLQLMRHLVQQPAGVPGGGVRREPPAEVDADDAPFVYPDEPEEAGHEAGRGGIALGADAYRAIVRWLSRAARPLPAQATPRFDVRRTDGGERRRQDERRTGEPTPMELSRTFDQLLQLVPAAVAARPDCGEAAGLMGVWAAKVLVALQLQPGEESARALERWLGVVISLPPDRTHPDIPALAAALIGFSAQVPGLPMSRALLKDYLENLPATAHADALAHANDEAFAVAPDQHRLGLGNALRELAAEPGFENQIVQWARDIADGRAAVGAPPELHQAMKSFRNWASPRKRSPVKRRLDQLNFCVHMYETFSDDEQRTLRFKHAVVCRGCVRPNFFFRDEPLIAELNQLLRVGG